jgi:hypothetical protein
VVAVAAAVVASAGVAACFGFVVGVFRGVAGEGGVRRASASASAAMGGGGVGFAASVVDEPVIWARG